MRLVPIRQPAIMRVRGRGQMIANTASVAPPLMHGRLFVEVDPSIATVIGMRGPANGPAERVHGYFEGAPRRFIGRFTVNASDNTILESLGAHPGPKFGDAVSVLVAQSRQVTLPYRPDVNRYESVQSGFYSFMTARENQSVVVSVYYTRD